MIKKQSGMTLIELAIGMMLGLALVASIGQLFSQSQKSFRLQKSLNDMTDDATFILEALAKGLNQAGSAENGKADYVDADINIKKGARDYPEDLNVFNSGLDFLDANCTYSSVDTVTIDNSTIPATVTSGPPLLQEKQKCEIIKGTNNQLIYRFRLNEANELDTFLCNSTLTYNKADMVTVHIYTSNDGNGTPVLYCKVKQAGTTNAIKNAEPLISDVEKLEFRYGIRIKDIDTTTLPNKRRPENDTFYYTTYDKVTADNLWTEVSAVKIFLVMRSAEKNLTRNKTGWQIQNTTMEYPTDDEGRIYKVFSKTVFLRAIAE